MQPSRRGFLGGLIAAPVVAPEIAKSVAADLVAPRRGTLGLGMTGLDWWNIRARAVGGNAGSAESVGIDLIRDGTPTVVERRVIRPLYPHPSGRPIRRTVVKERPIWRIPTALLASIA